ncbi:MAG: thiol reductant ABC exporter subunit CydD [Acetobacteraceae bacterium]|nr:thiol reductant ABC exporter subunit CydD [Acetobacteraceae bacterium]
MGERDDYTTTKHWLRMESRAAQNACRPVFLAGLANTALAIGQAFCAAQALSRAIFHIYNISFIGGFAVLAAMRTLLGIIAERASFKAGVVARRRLRSDSLARLLSAGPSLLRARHSGELAMIVVDRVEALEGYYARYIPAAFLAGAGPLLVFLAAAFTDPAAALMLGAAGLLVPFGMALAGIGAATASGRQFIAMARLQSRFLDRVRGIATIVLNGRAEDEARALAAAADELRRRAMRVLRVAFLSSAALDCALAGAIVVIAIRYAAVLAPTELGQAGLARAFFVLLLVPEFFAPLRAFSAAYQDRLHATGAAAELASLPPLPVPPPTLPVRTVTANGVSVAFENVRLIWDPSRGPALDGLSFRVPAGETLILVGPSGAGKSTVFEILLGFVRPDSGRVTINGADIADLVPQALSRLTAWIGQRPMLFAGSIRENIRFARPEASDAEVEEAAQNAKVSAFASDLPNGLDTVIGEGGYGLSGGQAQRVAIARAFLKNAPLLLLDEPTAHLDPVTESDVLQSLQRLALGRTAILASHSAAAHAFPGRRLDIRNGQAVPARGVA